MPSARQVRFLSGFTYYLGRYGLALPCQLMRRVSRARVAAAKRRERAFNSSRARRFGSVSRWRWTTEARGMTPSRAPTVASLGCSRPSDASPETASDERQECRRTAPSIGRRMPGPTPFLHETTDQHPSRASGERGAGYTRWRCGIRWRCSPDEAPPRQTRRSGTLVGRFKDRHALHMMRHRKDVGLNESRKRPGQHLFHGSLPRVRAPRASNERHDQRPIPPLRAEQAAKTSSPPRARSHSFRTQART